MNFRTFKNIIGEAFLDDIGLEDEPVDQPLQLKKPKGKNYKIRKIRDLIENPKFLQHVLDEKGVYVTKDFRPYFDTPFEVGPNNIVAGIDFLDPEQYIERFKETPRLMDPELLEKVKENDGVYANTKNELFFDGDIDKGDDIQRFGLQSFSKRFAGGGGIKMRTEILPDKYRDMIKDLVDVYLQSTTIAKSGAEIPPGVYIGEFLSSDENDNVTIKLQDPKETIVVPQDTVGKPDPVFLSAGSRFWVSPATKKKIASKVSMEGGRTSYKEEEEVVKKETDADYRVSWKNWVDPGVEKIKKAQKETRAATRSIIGAKEHDLVEVELGNTTTSTAGGHWEPEMMSITKKGQTITKPTNARSSSKWVSKAGKGIPAGDYVGEIFDIDDNGNITIEIYDPESDFHGELVVVQKESIGKKIEPEQEQEPNGFGKFVKHTG